MRRVILSLAVLSIAAICCGGVVAAVSDSPAISGDYVESRTCDIYTGPCFANAQVGLTGQQAIMAWSIDQGSHNGVDLAGMKVVLAVLASDSLAKNGGMDVNPIAVKSVILVDERASQAQREALVEFAKLRGDVGNCVTRVSSMPIEMTIDHVTMAAKLQAGKEACLVTRKLAKGDCVCSNEEIYYPPLAEVDNYSPAYAVDAGFNGKGLGVRWSNRKSRSAFLATFEY